MNTSGVGQCFTASLTCSGGVDDTYADRPNHRYVCVHVRVSRDTSKVASYCCYSSYLLENSLSSVCIFCMHRFLSLPLLSLSLRLFFFLCLSFFFFFSMNLFFAHFLCAQKMINEETAKAKKRSTDTHPYKSVPSMA